jgi:hypothetical protein
MRRSAGLGLARGRRFFQDYVRVRPAHAKAADRGAARSLRAWPSMIFSANADAELFPIDLVTGPLEVELTGNALVRERQDDFEQTRYACR